MSSNLRPRILNRICARPEILTSVLSVFALGVVSYPLWEEVVRSISDSWQWMLAFWFLAVPAAVLLTCLFGYLTLGIPICFICRRINGAPLKLGDQVVILTGPHKGAVATVNEITLDQGGSELIVIDLGGGRKLLFEEWSLLRTRRVQQGRIDWDKLTASLGLKRRMVHRICACPGGVALACMFAGGGLSALLLRILLFTMPLRDILPEIVSACILGGLISMPFSLAFCGRMNGGAIKPGDRVLVISGPYEGTVAEVSGIILQNGWTVAVLDPGDGHTKHLNTRSLVRIRKSTT